MDGTFPSEPIAVIGMSCRFPGAPDLAAFWQLLCDGRESISRVPADRWDAEHYYDSDPAAPGKMNSKWGGFLDQVDQFDAAFFGIAPREADLMDPQQRLLLEVSWEALEDAAIVPASLADKPVGVFIGLSSNNYAGLLHREPALINAFTNSGGSECIAANRISYTLNLRGPSMAMDTACSSSLSAVHLACQSLQTGESELALAGGANVILAPGPSISLAKARMLSPDGRCRVFDAGANGFGRAEGAGVVVLKPLPRALADGDPIYAVIRGTATQQNGRTNGLMAPSRWAQEAVVRDACRRAGVWPRALQYVETHSAGTLIGDATELNALAIVLAEDRAADDKCAIGSVKTNVGHLEAAAGIAGLIKVALMLQHRRLVPSLHFDSPNPLVPFDSMPLRIPRELRTWPDCEHAALAGVSGSGYGGVNVHIVLEATSETPVAVPSPGNGQHHVLALSARTAPALRVLAERYVNWLDRTPDLSIVETCFTAATGRTHFNHRVGAVVCSLADARNKLDAFVHGRDVEGLHVGVAERNRSAVSSNGHGQQAADIAAEYVRGATTDWCALYDSPKPNRIRAPLSPFDRRRHWMPLPDARHSIAGGDPTPSVVAPPRTATERALERIWHRVLGLEHVGTHDNFFDLGGGSLMVLEMFAAVANELKVELAPSLLFERPTIAQLAEIIEQHGTTAAAPSIVTIRAGDPLLRVPLFLVAPDHLLHYTQLLRHLDPNVPLFGLQPPFADGFRDQSATIEQMAQVYVAQVARVHPRGTCHLIGLCAGGVIAYEMARQLNAIGRNVGLLAMLDAPCAPPEGRRKIGRLGYLASRCRSHVRSLGGLSAREAMRYVAVRTRLMFGAVAAAHRPSARPTERSAALSSIANRSAIYRYRPRRYHGRIELFNAVEPYPSKAEDTRLRWRELASDVRMHWLPGYHEQIMAEPQIITIAKHVELELGAAQQDESIELPDRSELPSVGATINV